MGIKLKRFGSKLNVFAVSTAIALTGTLAPITAPVALADPCPAGFTFTAPNCQRSFEYTGAMQTFTVPAGVDTVTAYVIGARGGLSNPAPPLTSVTLFNYDNGKRSVGNNGAILSNSFPVTTGQTLNLFVGGAGQLISGGWNGGGKGAANVVGPRGAYDSSSRNPNVSSPQIGGGGGGASDIRIGGTALANRVIVAGGGGGTGFATSMNYGNTGYHEWYMGGNGNGPFSGQYGSRTGASEGVGKGGSEVAGGAGGSVPTMPQGGWCTSANTSAGTSGQGGYAGGNYPPDPSSSSIEFCPGGGGGGGYFGGGGGAGLGGGAGSSYVKPEWVGVNRPNAVLIANPPVGNGNIEGMVPNGNGRIIIAYRATTVIAVAPVTPVSTATTQEFNVTFAQDVTNFDAADITVKNSGTATGGTWTTQVVSSTNAHQYLIRVESSTPVTDGTVIVNVNAAGVLVGTAPGIGDLDGTARIDRTGPVPTSVTLDPSVIKTSPVTVTAVFNEAISNLDPSKVAVGGTSSGWTAGPISGSGTSTLTFTLSKSGTLTSGENLTVELAAAIGADSAGNTSSASSVVTANIDNSPPTATITHAMGSLTSLASMPYSVTFNKDVRWLKASNVASPSFSVTGTATGCLATPAAGSTTNRVVTVNVTGCGDGTVILNLLANSVEDLSGNTSTFGAGNAGPLARVAAASITRDGTAPTVTAFTQVTTTRNATTIQYSVTFSEAVTFDASKISLAGASGLAGTWTKTKISGTGSGPYVFQISNGSASHGDLIVRVASGVGTDAAGNPNVASNALTNSLLVMPSVTLGTPAALSKGTAVALVPGATITDHGTGLYGIRIKISAANLKATDVLSFTASAATGSIHASTYANGVLDLMVGLDSDPPGMNAQAPIAQWQAALRAVKIVTGDTSTAARNFQVILKPFRNFSYDSQHAFMLYPQTASHTTWTQAKAIAEASYLGTMQGYLPTITSAEESRVAWLASMVGLSPERNKFWLGGSDADVERTWKWVTGPESGTVFCQEVWLLGGCTQASQAANYNNWQPLGVLMEQKPYNNSDWAAMLPAYGYWADAVHDWNILGGNVTYVLVEYGSQLVGDASYNVSASGSTSLDSTPPVLTLTSDGGLIGGKLNYTLTGNEEILCSTASTADFTVGNGAITSVTQTGPKQCSIVVTPSLSAGSTGAVTISKSISFSVSDLSNNAAVAMASPASTSALSQSVTIPSSTTPTLPSGYLAVAPTTGFTQTDPSAQTTTNTALVDAKIVQPPAGAPSTSVSRDISDRAATDIVKIVDSITVAAGTKVDAALKANAARQSTSEAWAYLQLKNGNWVALGKRGLDVNGLAKIDPMAFTDPGTYVIKIIIADIGTVMPARVKRAGGFRAAAISGTDLSSVGSQSYDLTVTVTGAAPAVSNPTPQVTNVTSATANGTLTTGNTLAVSVTFDSAVSVNTAGGSPTLALNVGSSVGYASYASGSGSNTLVFNYTVRAGDSTGDLEYTSTSALTLNGGTITSAVVSANNAVLTLPAPAATGSLSANKAIVIDSAAPVITFAAAKTSSSSTTLTYLIIGNEPIDCSTLSATNGTDFTFANISSLTIVQTDPTTCTITAISSVASGAMGTSSLTMASSFSIADANGIAATTLSPTSAETLVNNGSTQASVTSVTTSTNGVHVIGDQLSLVVNFNQAVTVTGTPTLTLQFDGATKTATYTSGSGTNALTFNYVLATGDATTHLDYASTSALVIPAGSAIRVGTADVYAILPSPGSAGSLGATSAISTDTTKPTVTISAPLASSTASVVNFQLTSDKPLVCSTLSSVDGTDFTFTNAAGATVSQLDPSTCQIALITSIAIGSSGTTSIAAAASFAVSDTSGNVGDYNSVTTKSAGVAVTPQASTIPNVTSITATNANGFYGVGQTVNLVVHFDLPVQVTGTPQLVLNFGSGTTLVDYASGSGTGITFAYVIQAGDNVDHLDLASSSALHLNGGAITNATTNEAATLTVPVGAAAGSLASNSALVVDAIAPTTVFASASSSTTGRTLTFTVTGDEALDCSSLSPVDGVDFSFNNLSSVTISQASSRVCEIIAVSSISATAAGSSGLSAAQTFEVLDAHGVSSAIITNPSIVIAMQPASAGGTSGGGSTNNGSTSTTMPVIPSLPVESKSLSTSGGDSLALDGSHLDGVTNVTAIQNGKEFKVEIISSTASRLVVRTPALQVGSADLIIETPKGSIIFKNALLYIAKSVGSTGKPTSVATSKSFTVSGFAAGKSILTPAMQQVINKLVIANKSYRAIRCTGYTMGPTRSAADIALSKSRASTACDFALVKNKSLKIASIAGIRETKIGDQIRRISLVFSQ